MSHPPTTPDLRSEETAVAAAARDYFNAWFDGDAESMNRVLHPGLAKRSLRQVDPDDGELRSVTKAQMVQWTSEGEGKELASGGAPHIDVEVVDIYGNIANVVVRSSVYREYVHLVRTDDGWMIANALWHLT